MHEPDFHANLYSVIFFSALIINFGVKKSCCMTTKKETYHGNERKKKKNEIEILISELNKTTSFGGLTSGTMNRTTNAERKKQEKHSRSRKTGRIRRTNGQNSIISHK